MKWLEKRKMDFSKFSDADFDAKEWVNGALRAHKDARIPIDVRRTGNFAGEPQIISLFSGTRLYTSNEAPALYSGEAARCEIENVALNGW